LARIATGLSIDYLRGTCGTQPIVDVFDDPAASQLEDNVYFDLAYRCKGMLPPGTLRVLLDRVRAVTAAVSPQLLVVSQSALDELQAREGNLPRPYQQGRALAKWLRILLANSDGRAEPDNLLSQWGVYVDKLDFATQQLDAVAFWAHGRQPNILWNDSDKHISNEGARRATLAHEICHLLVDRTTDLPLSAVARGAVDRKLEQRANAFAAEFLCPSQQAATEFRNTRSVALTIAELTNTFGVSNELAALQLARSNATFDLRAQREIEAAGPPWARYPWSRR
jgi:Zn-dependent peptidase ImmA (M78 family)